VRCVLLYVCVCGAVAAADRGCLGRWAGGTRCSLDEVTGTGVTALTRCPTSSSRCPPTPPARPLARSLARLVGDGLHGPSRGGSVGTPGYGILGNYCILGGYGILAYTGRRHPLAAGAAGPPARVS
jgi:hypothetical protein